MSTFLSVTRQPNIQQQPSIEVVLAECLWVTPTIETHQSLVARCLYVNLQLQLDLKINLPHHSGLVSTNVDETHFFVLCENKAFVCDLDHQRQENSEFEILCLCRVETSWYKCI